jgi:hypothetical protein
MTVVRQTSDGIGLRLDSTASANLESWNSENSARQAIRQSLFIVNDFDQLLIIQRDSVWGLPYRQLLANDTWQLGIEAILNDLETQGAIDKDHGIMAESVSLPAALGEPGSIDLLIPCTVSKHTLNAGLSSSLPDGEHHKWVSSSQLPEFVPALDSKLVDKALKQVQH